MRKPLVSLSLAALLVLTACGKKRFYMPTEDMEPTIPKGSTVVADMKIYDSEPPRRFDLIVFYPPAEGTKKYTGQDSSQKVYCKRVVGLPNEKIEIKENGIYIDSEALELPEGLTRPLQGPISVQQLSDGEYFLLGDKSANSLDSRFFGPIQISNIVGKVIKIQPGEDGNG